MASNTPNPDAESSEESAGVGSQADAAAELSPMDRQADIRDLDSSLSAMTDLLLSATDTDCDLDGDFAVAGAAPSAEAPRPVVMPVAADAGPGVEPSSEGILGATDGAGSEGAAAEEDAVGQVEQVQAAVAAALSEVEADLGRTVGGDSVGATTGDTATDGPMPSDASPESASPDAIPTSEIDELMAAVSAELEELDAQADAAAELQEAGSDAEPPDAVSGSERGSLEEAEQAVEELGTERSSESESGIGETTGIDARAEAAVEPVRAGEETAPASGGSGPSVASGAGAAIGVASSAAPAAKATPGLKARVLAAASPLAARGSAVLADILTRGLEPLAELLAGQSKLLRHSLAWLALWTAFNAGCIWGFLVLFRSGGGPADASLVTQIAGSDAAPAGGEAPAPGPAAD
ncbi:MAG: hypothetical protein IT431_16500 [Phycisphaerales bacterium]|nr:hypothetical protein [Phycisphaerales bacterium]